MRLMRFGVLFAIATLAAAASAQTDENLLLTPWAKGQAIEARANALIFPSADLGANGGSLKMFEVESSGRYRYDLGYDLNPSVGYDLTYLNLDQHRRDPTGPRLPRQLTDVSIGFGSPITKVGEKGFLAATGAVGYAGDETFATGRAWYGKGSIMYGYNLKKGTDVLLLLDYNGNRSILPDTPLPAFAYSSYFNEDLTYVVGFPVNSLRWHPTPATRVAVNWYIPDSFSATASYDLDKQFAVFAGYDQKTDRFRSRNVPGDNALFFREQRLEAGVRWIAGGLHLEAAAGYAFGRSFETGFDSRDYERFVRVGNEPFVRLNIGISR